jgi:hypothetical protein
LTKYYWGDKTKKGEIGGSYSMNGGGEKQHTENFVGKKRRKKSLETPRRTWDGKNNSSL